ncbi:MAG: HDIG domain-containing protein [Planctomycetes bacterium]|nr:HDIG domain-containing protein [Planctomycetota bacterium]
MARFKKSNPRRDQVRKTIAPEKVWLAKLLDADMVASILIWSAYVVGCVVVLSIDHLLRGEFRSLLPTVVLVVMVSLGAGLYIHHFQKRMIKNHTRAIVLCALFLSMQIASKIGMMSTAGSAWSTSFAIAAVVMVAIMLAIAYDQRFAIDMSIFFAVYVSLIVRDLPARPYQLSGMTLYVVMIAGIVTSSFSLQEIRTRMKLLEVSSLTASAVFLTALSAGYLERLLAQDVSTDWDQIFLVAGCHGGFAFLVGLLIQSFLPLIEKLFRIATSMTLLDYSDANQPLLKKLAMEAPGTFSHCLMIGSIAEAAAEAIGRNGLLCRVGAYYHDIGKIHKPSYFIENQGSSKSKHIELSPTMSQLIIVGHVKDGIEMAKEYKLPAVLCQFIETHHGTTLVEPFYNEAMKKHEAPVNGEKPKAAPPSESEFRYDGPRPRSKEAAIVMLADSVEGAVRSLGEVSPAKVETVIHNISMKRLQDGQFDECDITLRELSQVEKAMSMALAAHYHGRIAYPKSPDDPDYLNDAKDKDKEKEKEKVDEPTKGRDVEPADMEQSQP